MRVVDLDAFEEVFVSALLKNGVLTANETRKVKLTPNPVNKVEIELSQTGQTVIAAEVYKWQNGIREKIERCIAVKE